MNIWAMMRATVVLPVPGLPRKSMCSEASAATGRPASFRCILSCSCAISCFTNFFTGCSPMIRSCRRAAAAVRAAEESQRIAEEKARAAEERRKVLEIESNTKSKQLSKQLEEKQGDLGEKARILRARADAATNEATALRAELKREKEKNEAIKNAAEKNDATEARLKALTVEAKRAREEAKKLKTEMDSRVGFETKQVQRELANERARSAKELAWFQSEMREMSAACDAAMAAAREEAFLAARTAAEEMACFVPSSQSVEARLTSVLRCVDEAQKVADDSDEERVVDKR